MEGWIKIHRQSINSSVWKNAKTWYIWCWCLMKATHAPVKFPFNGQDVELKPGEFVTGRTKALKELKNCSVQNYKTAIEYLKSTSRITTKVTNKFTIISICKWEQYQSQVTSQLTSKVNNQPPATNQPLTTYKNNKNIKNNKKLLPKKTNPLMLTRGQCQAYLQEFPGLTLEELKEQRLKCNNHMGMSSSDYTNPGLFFKGWLRQFMDEKRQKEFANRKMKEYPEISEEQRQRNIKRLSKIKTKLKGVI